MKKYRLTRESKVIRPMDISSNHKVCGKTQNGNIVFLQFEKEIKLWCAYDDNGTRLNTGYNVEYLIKNLHSVEVYDFFDEDNQ